PGPHWGDCFSSHRRNVAGKPHRISSLCRTNHLRASLFSIVTLSILCQYSSLSTASMAFQNQTYPFFNHPFGTFDDPCRNNDQKPLRFTRTDVHLGRECKPTGASSPYLCPSC